MLGIAIGQTRNESVIAQGKYVLSILELLKVHDDRAAPTTGVE